MDAKAPDAFRSISEVADELDLPQHVLRFWESRFRDIKPMKRGGGRRYYRPDDIDLLRGIRHLLYGEGYTIRGVQRILREEGAKFVQAVWQGGAPQSAYGADDGLEFADDAGTAEIDAIEDGEGLRGRLSSLIGRDLGHREDAGRARRDPPFKSAPVPHIEETDRAIRGVDELPLPPPKPGVPGAYAVAGGRLAHDDLRKLKTALDDLAECRKLLDAAVVRTD